MGQRTDRGDGAVIGEVLLIAGAIAGAVVIGYFFVGANSAPPPPALGLNDDGDTTAGTATFTVASVIPTLDWGSVSLLLDGTRLTYSSALATDNTFCVVAGGSSCTLTGLWDPTLDIDAGHRVRVHHSSLSGKTLLIRADETNALLYSKLLGGA